jgi:hypothetical protein
LRIITERNILNEHTSRFQIAFAATTVVILFVVCHYVFRLLWAETLSICVAYATNMSRRVSSLLLVLFRRDLQH